MPKLPLPASRLGQYHILTRTIIITVQPPPVSFYERRAVLNILQQHANVEVFKKLDQHSYAFMAVTADDAGTNILLDRSPIRYDLFDSEFTDVPTYTPNESSTSIPTAENAETGTGSSVHPERVHGGTIAEKPRIMYSFKSTQRMHNYHGTKGRRGFLIQIQRGGQYDHRRQILRSPLHGPWPERRQNHESVMAATLKEVLPTEGLGSAAAGLADWETGGQLEHDPLATQATYDSSDKEKSRSYWADLRKRNNEAMAKFEVLNGLISPKEKGTTASRAEDVAGHSAQRQMESSRPETMPNHNEASANNHDQRVV